jgi:hypothetical protein
MTALSLKDQAIHGLEALFTLRPSVLQRAHSEFFHNITISTLTIPYILFANAPIHHHLYRPLLIQSANDTKKQDLSPSCSHDTTILWQKSRLVICVATGVGQSHGAVPGRGSLYSKTFTQLLYRISTCQTIEPVGSCDVMQGILLT